VALPTKRRAGAAVVAPTKSNRSGSPPVSLARRRLQIGGKEQIPKMRGIGPSTISVSARKQRWIFPISLLYPDSTKMFYGTAGVTVSIWTIVEKQLTDFCHMFSQIVVWFCMQVILNLYQTNQYANLYFLSYGSHLKIMFRSEGSNLSKSRKHTFCLMFS
jgi:hypothetical protein